MSGNSEVVVDGSDLAVPTNIRTSTVAAYGLAKIVPGLVMMVSVPVWTRLFGVSAYGRYSVAWAATLIVTSLATGWLRQANLRYAGVKSHGLLAIPFRVYAVMILGAASATVLAVLALAGPSPRHSVSFLIAVAVFVGTFGVYLLLQVALQRDGRAGRYNVAEAVRMCGALGISCLFAPLASQGQGAALILLSSAAGNALAIVVAMDMRVPRFSGDWSVLRRSWSFGWPMSLWLALSALTLYTDRFVLSETVSRQETGLYAGMSDLVVRGIAMLAVPIVLTVHPEVMRAFNAGNFEAARSMLKRWSLIMAGLLGCVVVGLLFAGPAVLSLINGHAEYDRLTVVFLGVGSALWQYALLAHKPMEMAGQTKRMLLGVGAAWLVQVALSFLLAPEFGGRGTSLAMMTGSATYVGYVVVQSRGFFTRCGQRS